MQMNDTAIALLAAIAAAFANHPTLPRESLVFENTWETEDLIRDLASVGDTPDETFIAAHSSSLPAFTAEGFRHVLPQYLSYSVKNPRSDATERIIFDLGPEDTTSIYWQDRIHAFSRPQKDAICAYVRYMQSALAGEQYDEYFERALRIWECE